MFKIFVDGQFDALFYRLDSEDLSDSIEEKIAILYDAYPVGTYYTWRNDLICGEPVWFATIQQDKWYQVIADFRGGRIDVKERCKA